MGVANNGVYTVVSAVFGGVNTVITTSPPMDRHVGDFGFLTKGIPATYQIREAGTGVSVGDAQATIKDSILMAIVAVNVPGKTFSVSGDMTGLFAAPYNQVIIVKPSSAGLTLASAVYAAPNTVVTVTEDITAYAASTQLGPVHLIGSFGQETDGYGSGMTINVTAVS